MTFEEAARRLILVVVWCVLILRTPAMLRDARQRPLWFVLAAFALGSVVIQSSVGATINRLSGDPQLNNLVQGLWGILVTAIMLEFVLRLANPAPEGRSRTARIAWAAVTACAMTAAYALCEPEGRFNPKPSGDIPFTAYALFSAIYLVGSVVLMTWTLWCHLALVKARTLVAGLAMIALGNAAQIPFVAIRTLQRVTTEVPPGWGRAAFILSSVWFIAVPLGCVVAALEPVRVAMVYWCRRTRVYPLWRRLREATPELATDPPPSWLRDAVATRHQWERLHRRVVEIRDSIGFLHDAWASPELLERARRHAETEAAGDREQITLACWLAATERLSVTGAPKLYVGPDRALLPGSAQEASTARAEIRSLLRLHRHLRSRQVKDFAGDQCEAHLCADGFKCA
ncbi:hypothetical protein SAMN05421504_11119 [Amycolatopsis xylanica]|uniref:DUF6545 domain-containing protein n=1 Tax=Amycolatopsis xylanica TaxID=589385 RepID=A0A1H3RD94_9PSEU|nr:MAB_1171c family putative transporter [Amycolatopsis xylanica]SDZ23616.1 hypothetical protein SAMN05421504_11119 [Amycolatopsis xylanica]